jgi:hypothetical protein
MATNRFFKKNPQEQWNSEIAKEAINIVSATTGVAFLKPPLITHILFSLYA